ncbi:MAG: tetratricopeptide repeat protein [Desulfomonilaceae bacterium]
MAYDDFGDLDGAFADFKNAMEISPSDADKYNSRGELFRKKRMFPQAIADYRRAVALDRNFAEACYNIGPILESRQRQDQAVAKFEN